MIYLAIYIHIYIYIYIYIAVSVDVPTDIDPVVWWKSHAVDLFKLAYAVETF